MEFLKHIVLELEVDLFQLNYLMKQVKELQKLEMNLVQLLDDQEDVDGLIFLL